MKWNSISFNRALLKNTVFFSYTVTLMPFFQIWILFSSSSSLVQLILEDEFDISRRSVEGNRAKGAGRLKAGGAAGNGHASPVLDGALAGHVAAGHEAVVGRAPVHVEGWLAAHHQGRSVWRAQADGTLLQSLVVIHIAPGMPALKHRVSVNHGEITDQITDQARWVRHLPNCIWFTTLAWAYLHMSAVEVHNRLSLRCQLVGVLPGGHDQSVQPNWALRSAGVQGLQTSLELSQSGRVRKTYSLSTD